MKEASPETPILLRLLQAERDDALTRLVASKQRLVEQVDELNDSLISLHRLLCAVASGQPRRGRSSNFS